MKRRLLTVIVTLGLLLAVFVTPALAHDGVGGDELAAADIMLVVAACFFVIGGLGILYSARNGELRDPEGAKYTMLESTLVDEEGEDIEKYITIEVQ